MSMARHRICYWEMMPIRDLAALEADVRRDLALISYPELRWLRPTAGPEGEKVLDVLIVGGGRVARRCRSSSSSSVSTTIS